jgi:hypothetical protein
MGMTLDPYVMLANAGIHLRPLHVRSFLGYKFLDSRPHSHGDKFPQE